MEENILLKKREVIACLSHVFDKRKAGSDEK